MAPAAANASMVRVNIHPRLKHILRLNHVQLHGQSGDRRRGVVGS